MVDNYTEYVQTATTQCMGTTNSKEAALKCHQQPFKDHYQETPYVKMKTEKKKVVPLNQY